MSMKKLALISIATTSVLVLSGCVGSLLPNIYEFADPANKCGTEDIYLSVDEQYPILNTEAGTEISLSVTDAAGDPVSSGVLSTIEVEYRVGIFNSTGFRNIPLDGLSSRSVYSPVNSPSPEPLPTRDAFLDLFWDTAGPSPSPTPSPSTTWDPNDGELFFPVIMTADTVRGSLSELLVFPDIFDGELLEVESLGEFLEFQALVGTFPGVFLAKCLLAEPEYEANPYVAAAQIFPNTSVDDFEPEAQLEETIDFPFDGETSPAIVLYMPGELQYTPELTQGFGLIDEVGSESFSDVAAADRWLRMVSQDGVESESVRGFSFGNNFGDVSYTTRRSEAITPLDPGDYQMLLLYWNLDNFVEDFIFDGSLTEEELAALIIISGASHYDLNVSSSGVYTFTLIESPLTRPNRSPASGGRGMASLDPGQQTITSSTKGFRNATLTGSNLDLVSGVAVGGKSATVGTKSLTSISLSLPAHSAGMHDLVLSHNAGTTVKQDMVRYYKSKLIKNQVVEASAPKSRWFADLGKTIRATPKAVQVNCAVSVPEGKAGKALIDKARAVCAEVSKIKPALKAKVVIKKLADGVAPTLKIRYWN
jgi:hypothetical protein